jgi:hypothetical protein
MALALAWSAHAPQVAGAETPGASLPPAAFGTLPRASSVSLSPDGKSVAWIDAGYNPERILVFDLVSQKDRRIFVAPDGIKPRFLARQRYAAVRGQRVGR